MNSIVNVLFLLENNKGQEGYHNYISDLNSLHFIIDDEGNGLEFNVSYIEQISHDEKYEVEISLSKSTLEVFFGQIKNPLKIYGAIDGESDIEINTDNILIKEITELIINDEEENIHYCPLTMKVLGTE